ncbi:MAG: hypothetical protein ILO10_00365 [Kiritimatiellae bacterium]|nr:hypothetical protein [Kiritimatiellia bacterium]
MKRAVWAAAVLAALVETGAWADGAEWCGSTAAFRVDGGAGGDRVSEAREREWAVWDAAWNGAERVRVVLERPGGAVETLGEGKGPGWAEWVPEADEWGTFTLTCTALGAGDTVLGVRTARRARWRPEERGYGAWLGGRGGTVEAFPAGADADGDKATNWEEYVADTDPMDEGEVFESRVAVGEGGAVRVVPSVVSTGRVYGAKVWRDLTDEPVFLDLGPGHEGIGVDLNGGGEMRGFGSVSVSVP